MKFICYRCNKEICLTAENNYKYICSCNCQYTGKANETKGIASFADLRNTGTVVGCVFCGTLNRLSQQKKCLNCGTFFLPTAHIMQHILFTDFSSGLVINVQIEHLPIHHASNAFMRIYTKLARKEEKIEDIAFGDFMDSQLLFDALQEYGIGYTQIAIPIFNIYYLTDFYRKKAI